MTRKNYNEIATTEQREGANIETTFRTKHTYANFFVLGHNIT